MSHAQLQASKWYFNNKVAVDFSSGVPQILSDSQMQAVEGCASIADAEGNLLFYTNGQRIWNKNHEIMQGGDQMPGHYSSTQSALVVPNINDENIYYVFFVDRPSPSNAETYPEPNISPDQTNPASFLDGLLMDDGLNNGLNYVIVNMNEDNGNGAVISGPNHLITYNPNVDYEISHKCSEKLTGIATAEGDGFWVITFFINKFYAFKVDENGVNPTPVVSETPIAIYPSSYIVGAAGYLKVAPDGKHIAMANYSTDLYVLKGNVYLWDFNNETGEVNSPQLLLDNVTAYGVEFSSHGNKLYASEQDLNDDNEESSYKIYQFDMNSNSIVDSKSKVIEGEGTCGSLQLAIDGKIYYLNSAQNALSCIENPNDNAQYLTFKNKAVYFLFQQIISNFTTGLPNYLQSYFFALILYENTCFGEETQFTLDNTDNVASVDWDFGDGTTSQGITASHIYNAVGTYMVKAEVTTISGNTKSLRVQVTITDPITANSVPDIYGCDNDFDGYVDDIDRLSLTNQIKGTEINTEVRYFTEEGIELNEGFTNSTPNEQTVVAKLYRKNNPSCYDEITFKIHTLEGAKANPIADVYACEDPDDSGYGYFDTSGIEESLLMGQTGLETYYYTNNGEELPSPLPNPYKNKVQYVEMLRAKVLNPNTGCASSTPIRLVVIEPLEIPDIQDKEKCIEDIEGYATFNVQSIREELTINEDTSISFFNEEVENITHVFKDNYQIKVPFGETITIRINSAIFPDCYSEKTIRLIARICPGKAQLFFPKFFTPNNDSYNDSWQAFPLIKQHIGNIHIFNRYGKLLTTISPYDTGWDGTYNGKPMPQTDYWFATELDKKYKIQGHFSLIR